jgi:hypothetical protein
MNDTLRALLTVEIVCQASIGFAVLMAWLLERVGLL